MDNYYGGDRFQYSSASNIVFANGLLDPWSAAVVYTILNAPGDADTSHTVMHNMTHNGSIILFMLDANAHHLVLMFSHSNDPPCAKEGRLIQEENTLN